MAGPDGPKDKTMVSGTINAGSIPARDARRGVQETALPFAVAPAEDQAENRVVEE